MRKFLQFSKSFILSLFSYEIYEAGIVFFFPFFPFSTHSFSRVRNLKLKIKRKKKKILTSSQFMA